ncbi:hypothetical protein PV10_00486 [Exophiala mesophila]|uniref:RING-type E3 ubiquitin transferase n=1 Tax=Exophiala mesophila TaxID=212818 RepID=A0A0D2ACH1_EXOME|nr:uncharacterized protein PV10_00486 [Exophiala mesophila]KIV96648.1 hypothetical protein PV10_00486 [Exophiala mesophila]
MAQPSLDNAYIIITPNPIESPSSSLFNTVPIITSLPTDLPTPDHCVICLDVITEKAIALPCNHAQFDFPCLGTWLQRHQVCPLCKGDVTAIRFQVTNGTGDNDQDDEKIFHLPPIEVSPETRSSSHSSSTSTNSQHGAIRHRQRPGLEATYWQRDRERSRTGIHPRRGRGRGRFPPHTERTTQDTALEFRRQVYRDRLYALHVGSNRISRYRTLTPAMFQNDSHLVSRARMFLRRELQVFEFLYPRHSGTETLSSASSSSSSTHPSTSTRRANNADFVLEYVVSILQSIDLKGSSGQAEELLTDFLGRDNARLFIHELASWLRSPFEKLEHWDRNVQYATPASTSASTSTATATGRSEEKRQDHSTRDIDPDRRGKGNQRRETGLSSPSLSSRSTLSEVSSGGSNSAQVPQWFSDRFVLSNGGPRAVVDPP